MIRFFAGLPELWYHFRRGRFFVVSQDFVDIDLGGVKGRELRGAKSYLNVSGGVVSWTSVHTGGSVFGLIMGALYCRGLRKIHRDRDISLVTVQDVQFIHDAYQGTE